MSDYSIQARIESILGEALRRPAATARRPFRSLSAAIVAGAVLAAVAGVATADRLQQRQPISDLQLRQLQGYVCLISEGGEAPPDRLWHEMKLFFDIGSVYMLRRADFDRAIEWLDRRAQRAIGRPGPTLSGQRFCGDLPG